MATLLDELSGLISALNENGIEYAICGGLAMATVASCAGFGAVCGSSIATVGTMARIALPEMKSRGYADSLSTGSIASGATLARPRRFRCWGHL